MILYLFQNLPDNIHEMATGKLHISSTDAYTGENILISNYHSKKEVIDVSKNQIHEGKSALQLDTIAAFVFGEYLKHFWIGVGQTPVKNRQKSGWFVSSYPY